MSEVVMIPVVVEPGKVFGRLTVIERGEKAENGERRWRCRCECGKERSVRVNSLRSGRSRSCGCLSRDTAAKVHLKHGATRGRGKTPEYEAWTHMIQRCENLNVVNYESYGGRGIEVCDRWRKSFAAFLSDVGQRPSPAHSIDRFPNNAGGYWCGKPECAECGPIGRTFNVRWATARQQQRNTRRNRLVTLNGVTRTLAEWCERFSIDDSTAAWRLDKGWVPELAFALSSRTRSRRRGVFVLS